MKSIKLEIEIGEDEIRSTMEKKIRTAVAEQSNWWGADDYIRNQVQAHWKKVVDDIILEALNNCQALREKIAAQLERKIRAQLTAAMKAASKSTGEQE